VRPTRVRVMMFVFMIFIALFYLIIY
jgi:hypothetical protein